MIKNFNLVVSTYRNRENECISELWYVLQEMGEKRLVARTTGLPGLIVARTSLDPFLVVEKIRKEALDKPWYFRYILKIVPVEENVEADVEKIADIAVKLALSKIGEGETYRITVRKRLSNISRDEIIASIAPKIPRKVSLEHPDKVILIEIIGERAGVSVLSPEQIVSLQKIKRESRLG